MLKGKKKNVVCELIKQDNALPLRQVVSDIAEVQEIYAEFNVATV